MAHQLIGDISPDLKRRTVNKPEIKQNKRNHVRAKKRLPRTISDEPSHNHTDILETKETSQSAQDDPMHKSNPSACSLSQEPSDLTQNNNSLSDILETIPADVDGQILVPSIEEKNKSLLAENATLLTQVEKSAKDISSLTKTKERLLNKMAELEKKIEMSKTCETIEILNKKVSSLVAKNYKLESSAQEYEHKWNEMVERRTELLIRDVKKHVMARQQHSFAIEQEKLVHANADLAAEVNQTKIELISLQKKCDALSRDKKLLNTTITALKNSFRQELIRHLSDYQNDPQGEHQKLQKEHSTLQREHYNLQEDHQRFQEEHHNLQEDHQRFQEEYHNLQEDHQKLKKEHSILSNYIQKLERKSPFDHFSSDISSIPPVIEKKHKKKSSAIRPSDMPLSLNSDSSTLAEMESPLLYPEKICTPLSPQLFVSSSIVRDLSSPSTEKSSLSSRRTSLSSLESTSDTSLIKYLASPSAEKSDISHVKAKQKKKKRKAQKNPEHQSNTAHLPSNEISLDLKPATKMQILDLQDELDKTKKDFSISLDLNPTTKMQILDLQDELDKTKKDFSEFIAMTKKDVKKNEDTIESQLKRIHNLQNTITSQNQKLQEYEKQSSETSILMEENKLLKEEKKQLTLQLNITTEKTINDSEQNAVTCETSTPPDDRPISPTISNPIFEPVRSSVNFRRARGVQPLSIADTIDEEPSNEYKILMKIPQSLEGEECPSHSQDKIHRTPYIGRGLSTSFQL